MNVKLKIRTVLNENYGSFNTYLENKYVERLTEQLSYQNTKTKKVWATYNQVILELKNNLKDSLKVQELQYRLTDKEDPKNACIDVLETVKDETPELERLYYKIRNFY